MESPAELVSVVVPAYNESAVIDVFHARLVASLEACNAVYEIVYVDDGSSDGTADCIRRIMAGNPRVAFVMLSRNFGKELALTAGLQAATGDCVIVIDADLQDPPELIGQMLTAWRHGVDVVNMQRESREGETWFKKTSAHLFYRLLERLSDVPIPRDVGDFRLLSRRALDALNRLPERNRYMKGLFAWVGFGQVTIRYARAERARGEAKQNYLRLFGLAIEGITSFTVAPLRLASLTGLLVAGTAFALTVFYAVKALMYGDLVQGFPTLVVAVLGLGGLQLLSIGILGEYLGRTYVEVKGRPLFLIEEYRPASTGRAIPLPGVAPSDDV